MSQSMMPPTSEQVLLQLWRKAPLSWAIIRTPEIMLISRKKFTPPILEVGCGDGLVTYIISKYTGNKIDVGMDLDRSELTRAHKTGVYKKLIQADITRAPFGDNSFATVFANGVLEHIPDLPAALKEISRVLRKGGLLITTSPTDDYTRLLFYSRILSALGLNFLADLYGRFINKRFAHRHLMPLRKWKAHLEDAKLRCVSATYYNTPSAIALHDICLPFSILTKYIKNKTDRMVLFPTLREYFIRPLIPIINRLVVNQNPHPIQASVIITAKKIW